MEAVLINVGEVADTRALLGSLDPTALPVDTQLDLIEELRALQAAAAAALARTSVAFAKNRVVEAQQRNAPLRQQQASATNELALAHRISPASMSLRLERYRRLVSDMPQTLRVLASGESSEHAVLEVAKAAHSLTADDIGDLDRQLAPVIRRLTPRQAEGRVRRFCCERDPETIVRRMRRAESESNVSCRPVADGMARLSVLAPMPQAVGMYAALRRDASTDPKAGIGLGRRMSELAFERITGLSSPSQIGVEIQLVMTDQTLLGTGPGEPARLAEATTGIVDGWLPIEIALELALAHGSRSGAGSRLVDLSREPGADAAREAAGHRRREPREAPDRSAGQSRHRHDSRIDQNADGAGELIAPRWIRRLYTDPVTGTLTALDSRRRDFSPAQRRYLATRDQYCTTPWCGAPIRHADHATPRSRGGPTSLTNGNGKCQRCNQTKDLPGWSTRAGAARPGEPHQVELTSPSGRTYPSSSPPVLSEPGLGRSSPPIPSTPGIGRQTRAAAQGPEVPGEVLGRAANGVEPETLVVGGEPPAIDVRLMTGRRTVLVALPLTG